jgi:hypothetical protein
MLDLLLKRFRCGERSIHIDERLTALSRGLSHDLAREDCVAARAVRVYNPAIEAADRVYQTRRSGFESTPQGVREADIAFAAVLARKG